MHPELHRKCQGMSQISGARHCWLTLYLQFALSSYLRYRRGLHIQDPTLLLHHRGHCHLTHRLQYFVPVNCKPVNGQYFLQIASIQYSNRSSEIRLRAVQWLRQHQALKLFFFPILMCIDLLSIKAEEVLRLL